MQSKMRAKKLPMKIVNEHLAKKEMEKPMNTNFFPKKQMALLLAGGITVFTGCSSSTHVTENSENDMPAASESTAAATEVVEQNEVSELEMEFQVNFDFDSADVPLAEREKLEQLLNTAYQEMRQYDYSVVNIKLSGYTDAIGPKEYNKDLSARRAESVSTLFKDANFKVNNVVLEAFGESNPVATNATRMGREQNRRVEVVLDVVSTNSMNDLVGR